MAACKSIINFLIIMIECMTLWYDVLIIKNTGVLDLEIERNLKIIINY